MSVAVLTRGETMERKRISISSKRQITIPQKFYDELGFDSEAECVLQDGALILRPVRNSGGEFAEQILADLIAQGYAGEELLEKFKAAQKQVRPAVERLIEEADEIAAKPKGKAISLDYLFGPEG